MRRFLDRKDITGEFGLALLTFVVVNWVAYQWSLSLALFVLMYYLLSRLLTSHQQTKTAPQQAKDQLQDITERQRASDALQQAEEKYHSIFENAIVGIFQTSLDGQYLTANPKLARIYGYSSPAQLIASISNIKRQLYVDPNRRDEFIHLLQQHETVSGFESQVYRRDGEIIWISEQVRIVRDGGIPLYYEGTVVDITERKQAEAERAKLEATLREAERRWRTLLENVRLVVVGLDTYGRVEYVNPFFLELTGYTEAEVQGQNWFTLFLSQSQRQRVQQYFLDLLEQEFQPHYQNSIRISSGEERVIDWNTTLLRNPQGEIIGTMSIGEDITERQAIERMKDEFVSVVSHELRTPLTSIHGGLNLLSSHLIEPQSDKGRHIIEIAAESADRLVRLVNDILELERLESGKISLLKQPCNAAELMEKATDMMQVMANRSGILLSVSHQSIDLFADPDRIIQVLTNLLGNAMKFSPTDSTVWLSVKLPERSAGIPLTDGNTLLFQVKDRGRGIPGDKIDSIFERFHQVDASDARKKGGTGLGLAICRSIVQQHGGQIWAESVLGEGSSFYFTLPLTAGDINYDNQASTGD